MEPIIAERREEIAALCRRTHVRRLDLFGSGATGRFDPARSDLDFLVEFEALAPERYAEAWFELREGLERLFGRPPDLVTAGTVRNPYLAAGIETTRQNLYAA
jgi:uncharacterized protein